MLKENKILNPELAKNVNADLLPTDERIMDPLSYGASFMGGCVSIGTFSMGASLIGALTIAQAIIAMCIGCAVIAVALVLIGNYGHKYGVPFTVQARQSFGFAGVKIPGFMRGIPAIVWFGFQSWVGAGAINSCLKILFGFSKATCRWFSRCSRFSRSPWPLRASRKSSGWKTCPACSSSGF